jgi:hypothetical protein
LILCAALVASAAVDLYVRRETGLRAQREWARQVAAECGPGCNLVSLGQPELLVLLHRTNPNPYPFIVSGIGNRIEATTPGGFDGWLEAMAAGEPDVIAVGPTEDRYETRMLDWLRARYRETMVGDWTLFVAD